MIAVAIVCVAGLALGFASLLWRSPDYARLGTCSDGDIERAYAAITAMHDWNGATVIRVRTEAESRQPPLKTLEQSFRSGANVLIDKYISRRNTAAFTCNHSYVRFGKEAPIRSLPVAAARLRPASANDYEAWKLAQCLSYENYSPLFPRGARPDDIATLRQVCASRETRNVRWEQR